MLYRPVGGGSWKLRGSASSLASWYGMTVDTYLLPHLCLPSGAGLIDKSSSGPADSTAGGLGFIQLRVLTALLESVPS